MNQKFTLFTFCLFAVGILCCTPTFAQDCQEATTCRVDGGASQPDVAANSITVQAGANASSPAVTVFTSVSSQFTAGQYVLTGACQDVDGTMKEPIITLSSDGSFDLSELAEGEYKVSFFAYNQAELDAFAETVNPLLPVLGVEETIPCCPVELSAAFETIGIALQITPSIEDVEDALCTTLSAFASLAYDLSAPYTITLTEPVGVGINSATVNPTNINIAQISPVPAIHEVQVTLASNTFENATVNIYDVAGQLMSTTATTVSGSNTLSLDINDYAQGVYFVQVTTATESVTDKFVKQ